MKNNGKQFEKVIWLIQETLKDNPNTKIHLNHKIANATGDKREFDILICTTINDIEINIAIECKSNKRPVGIKEIDAFLGKCSQISKINKMIFVSQSGYQKGAINVAKEKNIDLCTLENINKDIIESLLPIFNLGVRFKINKLKFFINTNEEELQGIDIELFKQLYVEGNIQKIGTIQFLNNWIISQKKEILGINTYEFITKNDINNKIVIPFELRTTNFFALSTSGKKYFLNGINGEIETWLERSIPNFINSQKYISNEIFKANRLTIEMGGTSEIADIITTDNNLKIFQTDKLGKTTELEVLATYNPKTGNFFIN